MQVSAVLVVSGFECDPDEVTRVLGTPPSVVLRRGVPPRPGAAPPVENSWRCRFPSGRYDRLELEVDHFLDAIDPCIGRLAQLPRPAEVTLACGVYSDNAHVDISLSQRAIRTLARIGAAVSVSVIAGEDGPAQAADDQPG